MSDFNEMNVGPRWYIAHTYSGYENKVKASIEKVVENRNLQHLIYDIRVPVEIVIEKSGDKEKEVENKVKASLEKIIENRNLGHLIFDIRIPVETIVEKNGDEEKETELKVFPCYVYIKMVMNEESWHAVRNITGVTGFVGPGSRPTPLSDAEVEELNIDDTKKVELSLSEGDTVTITAGLFEGFTGTVQSISADLKTVTVLVKRGRRDMPVELDAKVVKLA